jgi:hypothetical protein
MNKWINGIIMENNLELKIESIVREGKKHNMIDRFFHYSIEESYLIEDIENQNLPEEIKQEALDNLYNEFYKLKMNLIYKIKYSFGLHDLTSYLLVDKPIIINNPLLLGISPFLFDQIVWENVILNEIELGRYDIVNSYNLEKMIKNSLDDALYRLDKEEFNSPFRWQYQGYIPLDSDFLFALIQKKALNVLENSKCQNQTIKEFIEESLANKNLVDNYRKITLSGNFNTGRLRDKFLQRFGKNNIKLTADEKKDIQSFIGQNFKNSAGKGIVVSEIKNKTFFYTHLKLIKDILVSNSKEIKCNNNEISILIHKTFPEYLNVKTIENY